MVHETARRTSQLEDQKQIDEAQRKVLTQVVQHVISMPPTPRQPTVTTGAEPVSPANAGKTMRAASAEVTALLEAAQQSRRAPTGRQTPYLAAVSWMGMDPEAVAQMTENDYWLKVFFTGIIPEEFKEMPWMADNGVLASSVITSMPRLEESLMSAEHMDDLDACMYESAETHDTGVFMPPPKRAASDRARAVIAIDNYADHEAHIQKWRALFNMGALADDTWLRRLSNMKQAVWFYLASRGISPWRFLLNSWGRLPEYVRNWEIHMLDDFVVWYASSVGSSGSVANLVSDLFEWWRGGLDIVIPQPMVSTIRRRLRMITLSMSKSDLSTKLRISLPVHMFMCLVHEALRQRADESLTLHQRIQASSVLLCITGSRQSCLRIGNMAVGTKWDPAVSPQPYWTMLSMTILLSLKPGENAFAMPPRIKTNGKIAREPFPWLFDDVPWNFVHALKRHFALVRTPEQRWGTTPLITSDDQGTSMSAKFVYKWMNITLKAHYGSEIEAYTIGTHCLRIAGQTITKFLGAHTSVRDRIGQWSSATAVMDGATSGQMNKLYGRAIREILVEVQRFASLAVFQTCEWAGVRFAGHDSKPFASIQSADEVSASLQVRHEYLKWSQALEHSDPVEFDTAAEDKSLVDTGPMFDASNTADVVQFMSDAQMPVVAPDDKAGSGTPQAKTATKLTKLQRAAQNCKKLDSWAKPVTSKPAPTARGTRFADDDDAAPSDTDADEYEAASLWNEDRMRSENNASDMHTEQAEQAKVVDTLLDGGDTRAYIQLVAGAAESVMETCVMHSDGSTGQRLNDGTMKPDGTKNRGTLIGGSLMQRQQARAYEVGGVGRPECPNRGIALHAFSCPTCCE
jgi:hypothetical protein